MATTLPLRLDPVSHDLHGQNARLREQGSVVQVELPGGVLVWSVTRHRLLRALLADPRAAADPRHWTALRDGRIPDGWPLIDFVRVRSMTSADGSEHRRLRGLVSQAFTPRRVALLRPAIERTVQGLLDGLSADLGAPTVDFVAGFAYPLPLTVICDLLGFPVDQRERLHQLSMIASNSLTTPEEKIANSQALVGLLAGFVAERRANPRDDFTGDLITAVTAAGEGLSERELVDTLLTLLIAGHGTVTKLLTNAVRALLANPDQRALLTSGRQPWSALVEETLRWDSPLGHFPMRYATEDLELDGTVIPAGDAIILSYAAVGRDAETFGPEAELFDLTRPPTAHLSFGHGVHFCLGVTLARLEAEIALPALFTRFPSLAAGQDVNTLTPIPSIIANSVQTLPVTELG